MGGWEPRTFTEYFYDADGRLAGSVQTVEPEWDTTQVDLMIAYAAFKADVGTHGHLMSEAMSSNADPNNREGNVRFLGEGPFWDWVEKARLDKVDAYKAEFSKDNPPNLNGAIFTVRRVDYRLPTNEVPVPATEAEGGGYTE